MPKFLDNKQIKLLHFFIKIFSPKVASMFFDQLILQNKKIRKHIDCELEYMTYFSEL